MRNIAWAGLAACTMLLMLATANAAAAGDDGVSACLASDAYLDGGDTVDLCDPASRADGLDPKTLSAVNVKMGEAFYFARRPGLAVPYLDEAIKLDPTADQAFRRRGWAHLMQREFSAAMSDFTDYLSLKPDDPDAQFAMAYARYSTGGNCVAAARDYERILAQHPDHYITRYNIAGVYSCIDSNHVRELDELKKILSAGRAAVAEVTYFGRNGRGDLDFYAHIYDQYAGRLFDLGRYDEARPGFDWLVDNYPDYMLAFVRRSNVRTDTGDPVGGLADAEKALSMYPGFPYAEYAKLAALNGLRRNEETISYATETLATGHETKNIPWVYLWRGLAYKRLGLKSEALHDLTHAVATHDGIAWSIQSQLNDSGYLFGPQSHRTYKDGGPPLDFRAKGFANALKACMIDPECFK